MKRLIAVALCVLMLLSFAACSNKPSDTLPNTPPEAENTLIPLAEKDDDSVFLGTWTVSENSQNINKLVFLESGNIEVYFGNSKLGGVFFDKESKISMHISRKVIEGPYTVDGNVITITTETEVLKLTKAA